MTDQMLVLVVEDREYTADLIRRSLIAERLLVEVSREPAVVLERPAADWPDLVILEMSWGGGRGLELCRSLREASRVPILAIGAPVAVRDKLDAFAAGADDYLCSPFHPLELAARVRAILRCRRPGRLRPDRVGV